jgi:hypothetical protein
MIGLVCVLAFCEMILMSADLLMMGNCSLLMGAILGLLRHHLIKDEILRIVDHHHDGDEDESQWKRAA